MAVDYNPEVPGIIINPLPENASNISVTRTPYHETGSFRFWCQKVLPLVYDDSLSYYELLCKVVNFLNEVIENIDNLHAENSNVIASFGALQNYVNANDAAMTQFINASDAQMVDYINSTFADFQTAYNQLQTYVNDYFDNLDVQQEINAKLDEMADNGELTDLIQPFFSNYQTQLNALVARLNALEGNYEPGGTTADAELTDIRVATNNYVYPTAGDSVRGQIEAVKTNTVINPVVDLAKNVQFWKNETFMPNVGFTTDASRLAFRGNLLVDDFTELKINILDSTANIQYNIAEISTDNTTVKTEGTWNTAPSASYTFFRKPSHYLIMLKYSDNSNIDTTALNAISIEVIYNNHDLDYLRKVNNYYSNVKFNVPWHIGILSAETDSSHITSLNNAVSIISDDIIVTEPLTIGLTDYTNYKYSYYPIDPTTGYYESGWSNWKTHDVTISEGIYRFCISSRDGTTKLTETYGTAFNLFYTKFTGTEIENVKLQAVINQVIDLAKDVQLWKNEGFVPNTGFTPDPNRLSFRGNLLVDDFTELKINILDAAANIQYNIAEISTDNTTVKTAGIWNTAQSASYTFFKKPSHYLIMLKYSDDSSIDTTALNAISIELNYNNRDLDYLRKVNNYYSNVKFNVPWHIGTLNSQTLAAHISNINNAASIVSDNIIVDEPLIIGLTDYTNYKYCYYPVDPVTGYYVGGWSNWKTQEISIPRGIYRFCISTLDGTTKLTETYGTAFDLFYSKFAEPDTNEYETVITKTANAVFKTMSPRNNLVMAEFSGEIKNDLAGEGTSDIEIADNASNLVVFNVSDKIYKPIKLRIPVVENGHTINFKLTNASVRFNKFNIVHGNDIIDNDYFFIGHRGFNRIVPENTMVAFKTAYDLGLRRIETDLQRTSDGYWVLLHDTTIDRTSNGTGTASEMTLAQLRQYDFGYYRSELYHNTPIPLLSDLLNFCVETGVRPMLEFKSSGLTSVYAQEIKEVIDLCGVRYDKIDFVSFHVDSLAVMAQLLPESGYYVNSEFVTEEFLTLAQYTENYYLSIFNPSDLETSIEDAKENAKGYIYTTNSVNDIKLIKLAGGNGVCTDYQNLSNCYF